jgi:CheY-like chemotaxis protein
MVYGTVKKHGGHISLRSAPGRGTAFRIYLPISQTLPAEKVSGGEEPRLSGSETVLVAEDDDNVRDFLSRALGGAGYRVIEAVDGVDAVEKFRDQADGVDLLLLDLVMPRQDGRAAYEEISRMCPGVKAVFISGYTWDDIRTTDLIRAGHALISKPVSSRDILARVRESLDSYK